MAFSLAAEAQTDNSTIVSLIRSTEVFNAPSAVVTNPRNGSFAEDAGPTIHMNSIVPRLSLSMMFSLTQPAIVTDDLRSIVVKWMPIYIAFLDDLEVQDDKTNTQIEDVLELQHETGAKDTYLLYDGNKLGIPSGTAPMSTVAATEVFGDYGLTTNTILEGVAFDEDAFWDNMHYKTNKEKLRKVTGPMKSILVTRDRPYRYYSNKFTYPTVKRGNPYTFCGILFHVPQGSESGQTFLNTDTTAIPHVNISLRCKFEEWNPSFSQEVT